MNLQDAKTLNECPHADIAAYIDGELAPREELELEMHLAVCESCAEELNQQKKLLCALDYALEEEKFELPENFTKVVVANAESSVSGLRRRNERFNALFICSALFLLVFAALGNETGNALFSSSKFIDKFFAVGAFIGHLIYDVAIGTIVVLRSLIVHFVRSSASAFALAVVTFVVFALVFSRLLSRFRRI
ncbi:MAG TPA: zf-HC2 domain-containing protein [Pyrinomonadaceae bacterium]|jgi:predicted anti-sigma-YlaC factor YlaD